jgi:hypothetical protein
MHPILEYDRTMKTSQAPTTRQPDDTRASIAFRVVAAVATCLLVVLGSASMHGGAAADSLTWFTGLLAGGCVFVLADILLAVLVVGIPPGLFVLALVGLLSR